MPLDSTPFDDYTDRSLLPQVSTSPSDYRPPPNSAHARINLPRPRSTTPSGVPQFEPQSVFVPRLPNSLDNTDEDNLPKPIHTSHDLAHSTRFPKPVGYNLEWPRVTPIQVALVIGPLAKHHIKTFIQSCVESSSQSNSAPKIALYITRVARRKLVSDRLTVSSCR